MGLVGILVVAAGILIYGFGVIRQWRIWKKHIVFSATPTLGTLAKSSDVSSEFKNPQM